MNEGEERFKLRDSLIELFIDFKPEIVCEKYKNKFGNRQKNIWQLPEGSLKLNSNFYLTRKHIDDQSYQYLLYSPGALIRIKAPRYKGKTSLMNRLIDYANQQQGWKVIHFNFTNFENQVFSSLNKVFTFFVQEICYKLSINFEINFTESRSVLTTYADYMQTILNTVNCPLVLALDNVDRVFQYPDIFPDFCRCLRNSFEESKNIPIWENLRHIISYSTEDYAKLPINESPFNVGLNVELPDFNLNLIKNLAKLYDQSENVADSLYQLLGGHPYLTHLALYNLAYQYLTLDDLLNYAATDEGIYRNHLHHYLMMVKENPDLQSALQQVINSDRPIILEKTIADKLKSLGLIKSKGNLYKISCQIYQQYFAFHLQNNLRSN